MRWESTTPGIGIKIQGLRIQISTLSNETGGIFTDINNTDETSQISQVTTGTSATTIIGGRND